MGNAHALLTEQEEATLLKVSKRHLLTLRQKHLIPFVRLGRVVRYDHDEVVRAKKLTIWEHGRT
jgi:excisionase family DNA binding protein